MAFYFEGPEFLKGAIRLEGHNPLDCGLKDIVSNLKPCVRALPELAKIKSK